MLSVPYPVVLASASPRRQQLLATLVPEFEVEAAGIEEDSLTLPDPWETATGLALAKARAVAESRAGCLVIGGDTVVAIPGDHGFIQLAKPSSPEEAMGMLRQLSGRDHLVVTGIALVWPGGQDAFSETTRVFFKALGEEEIHAYVATGEPMDKAGSYGIQDGSAGFVAGIEGSFSNVVGLPIEKLRERLAGLFADR